MVVLRRENGQESRPDAARSDGPALGLEVDVTQRGHADPTKWPGKSHPDLESSAECSTGVGLADNSTGGSDMASLVQRRSFVDNVVQTAELGDIAEGSQVSVETNDHFVIYSPSGVASVLPPGRHVLSSQLAPALASLVTPQGGFAASGAFIGRSPIDATASRELDLPDTQGNSVPVRFRLSLRVAVADAGLFVHASRGNPEGLSQYIGSGAFGVELIEQAVGVAVKQSWSPTASGAEVLFGEILGQVATERAAPLGLQVVEAPQVGFTAALEPNIEESEPIYEMLWDCESCRAEGLLGLTHRHCPNCGAPQDATKRYFPTDDKKVSVQNHRYAGADRLCAYCRVATSRASKYCGGCGAPLEEGKEIQRRQDGVDASAQFIGQQSHVSAPKPKKSKGCLIVVGVACLLFTLILVAGFWRRGAQVTVSGHTWTREISIEQYQAVDRSDWCSNVPASVVVKSRAREVKDHEKVKSGEQCKIRKVDRGDGTFKEQKECSPTYTEKPIYADKCTYSIREWQKKRSVKAEGNSLQQRPAWPTVQLTQSGLCLGCEREGSRSQEYTVLLRGAKSSETYKCTFDEARWQKLAVGSAFKAEVGVIGDVLDCDSLKP